MKNIKIPALFLTTLVISLNAMADVITSDKENSKFHCTATTPLDGNAPTIKIDTHNRLVRGLCSGGNSIGGGTSIGAISQQGHLTNLPISGKLADGTAYVLSDLCFDSKADKHSPLGKATSGSISVEPQTGPTSIHCEEGCANTKFDFGIGNYC